MFETYYYKTKSPDFLSLLHILGILQYLTFYSITPHPPFCCKLNVTLSSKNGVIIRNMFCSNININTAKYKTNMSSMFMLTK